MILNKNHYAEIRNGKITTKNKSYLFPTLEKLSKRTWYIEICDPNSFCDDVIDLAIPPHIQSLIINSNVNLFICNFLEGFHSIVPKIYEHLIIQRNIPEEKIILFSESHDILKTVNWSSTFYNKSQIKTYYFKVVENDVAVQAHMNPPIIEKKITDKKFINLNRRWRPHRPTFVSLLHNKDLLKYGYVSLANDVEGSNWNNIYDHILYLNKDFETVHTMLLQSEGVKNLPSLIVDNTNLQFNDPLQRVQNSIAKFYNETLFSIVGEINYYTTAGIENSIFITEKTYKAMVFKHPFIILSVPFTLKALRTDGYKTFDGIINEDYDNIENDGDRMLAILKEVERLCVMDSHESVEFLSKCKDICDHNYNLLLSKRFLDKCLLSLN